jgi:hypothetical protein
MLEKKASNKQPLTNARWRRKPLMPTKKIPGPGSASELYRPRDRRFSAKLVPTFANRGCHVVSVPNPYGRNLGLLDRSRYFFFQVAPQLYSRGWVDPVPDPLLLRKSGSTENRTRTSGSVARNSVHWTTKAVRTWQYALNNRHEVYNKLYKRRKCPTRSHSRTPDHSDYSLYHLQQWFYTHQRTSSWTRQH